MQWLLPLTTVFLGSVSAATDHSHLHYKRETIIAQNVNTTKFSVDGNAIPGECSVPGPYHTCH